MDLALIFVSAILLISWGLYVLWANRKVYFTFAFSLPPVGDSKMPRFFSGQRVSVNLRTRNRLGEDVALDGIPTWESEDPNVVEVVPNADGLQASLRFGRVGSTRVIVRGDADTTPGLREVTGFFDIEVTLDGEVFFEFTFGEPDFPALP